MEQPFDSSSPPQKTSTLSAIVGIGSSAGGLQPLGSFFRALKEHKGMAFVVVQHLEPAHASLLVSLLSKWTDLAVKEAANDETVRGDTVYVIPPGLYLSLKGGRLQTSPCPKGDRSTRFPIDVFFRSLALDYGSGSVGIVLSGAGTDGTLGLAAIKLVGGRTLAQDPESAAYSSMPQSAVESGAVDQSCCAEQMPGHLQRFLLSRSNRQQGLRCESANLESNENFIALIKNHSGNDFSGYKPTTLSQQIERRMFVNKLRSRKAYLTLLQRSPGELTRLERELMIGVTGFFRDPKAFQTLQEHLVSAIVPVNRDPDDPIRIWIAGCSTGEEAYSLAMTLTQLQDSCHPRLSLTVFATDIDPSALKCAREGLYSEAGVHSLSALQREGFFIRETNGYRVKPSLRQKLVFAEHNVLTDIPFSRIDVVSCRNLMIYLQPDHQRQILETFHYSLKPQGILFLGTSESSGACEHLFRALNYEQGVYQKIDQKAGVQRLSMVGRSRKTSGSKKNLLDLQERNENLVCNNEELQSIIEELRSANDEKDCSRKQMQFMNEELQGLNTELQSQLETANELNEDVGNILDLLNVAVIFLDQSCRITHFTPAAARLVHLIPTDVDRFLGDLTTRFEIESLELLRLVENVLQNLTTIQRKIISQDGLRYIMSILPYRRTDNTIKGTAVTFVDITGDPAQD